MSDADIVAATRAAFRELTGRDPAGMWRAPGRVNLIGEHTDYNDGFVCPLAIDRHIIVAGAPRRDGVLRVRSLDQPDVVEVATRPRSDALSGWAAYVAGTAWAIAEAGHAIDGGADLVIGSTLPAGAGLSSSAALECGTGRALAALHGVALPDRELARLAHRAENVFVGVPCGPMDQLASACGRAGHVLAIDIRELRISHYPFDLEAARLVLWVIDTRAHRKLRDGGYADRRAACERAAHRLGVAALRDIAFADLDAALARLDDPVLVRRARHVVSENERVVGATELLAAGRLVEIGPLLTASHVSLRDDFDVSCAELDTAVAAALAAGALGARMIGGGFGGSAIALVSESRAGAVADAVRASFAAHGFAPPSLFRAVAAGGVHGVSQ